MGKTGFQMLSVPLWYHSKLIKSNKTQFSVVTLRKPFSFALQHLEMPPILIPISSMLFSLALRMVIW